MKARLRWILIAAAVVTLIGLVVVGYPGAATRLPPPLNLEDGTVVILRGVTYGTNHIAPGPPGLRLLPRAARRWLERHVPSARSLFSDQVTTEPSLLLWVEAVSPPGGSPGVSMTTTVMLADEARIVSGPRQSISLSGLTGRSGQVLSFPAAPSRSGRLRVMWSQGPYDSQKPQGEWRTGNPAFSTVVPWDSEVLPASKTSGDLRFVLKRLVFGVGNHYGASTEGIQFRSAPPGGEVRSLVLGTVLHEGRPSTEWSVSRLEISDPAGWNLSSGSMSQSSIKDSIWASWDPCLWPNETWQIEIHLKRRERATFAEKEIVAFQNVELSETGTTLLQERATHHGATIHLEELTLSSATDGKRPRTSTEASRLKVTIAGLSDAMHADFLDLEDENGRIYTSGSWSGQGQKGSLRREYYLYDLTNQIERVNVRFAIHAAHVFTFKVRPEMAQTNVVLSP